MTVVSATTWFPRHCLSISGTVVATTCGARRQVREPEAWGRGRKLCQVGGWSAPEQPGGLYVSFCEHLRESDIFGLQS